jgi:hypothetical protein
MEAGAVARRQQLHRRQSWHLPGRYFVGFAFWLLKPSLDQLVDRLGWWGATKEKKPREDDDDSSGDGVCSLIGSLVTKELLRKGQDIIQPPL